MTAQDHRQLSTKQQQRYRDVCRQLVLICQPLGICIAIDGGVICASVVL
ncbi:MAG: hypothetical protein KJ643_11080 [Gammaproteobacteria bacterium]|nr:hypothetical protein [Gammaproteobacteria bacterium]MBU0806658.1 hypothetical protein [Gammaproteobacteria bacterium]MBU0882498.1 hypothetical protein [Gammaproteobacteria bacterium]MBU1861089.1 hypothetical protein [Gammaproteobacteria bacterium]